jgi:hypothetical protein
VPGPRSHSAHLPATGQAVVSKLAVEEANERFYKAFRSGSIKVSSSLMPAYMLHDGLQVCSSAQGVSHRHDHVILCDVVGDGGSLGAGRAHTGHPPPGQLHCWAGSGKEHLSWCSPQRWCCCVLKRRGLFLQVMESWKNILKRVRPNAFRVELEDVRIYAGELRKYGWPAQVCLSCLLTMLSFCLSFCSPDPHAKQCKA